LDIAARCDLGRQGNEWFGVSWQIVPTALDQLLSEGTEEQIARVTQAFLQMKKFDAGGVSQGDLTRLSGSATRFVRRPR
jgi:hypothetical protein